MLDEYLLVDGYNIIFASEELKKIVDEDSLESARIKLMDQMCDYQGYYQVHVIVIFDSHKTNEKMRKIFQYHNIEVVFTKERETADHFIERVTDTYGRHERIRVATSDGLEQLIILSKGATRLPARELIQEIEAMRSGVKKTKERIKQSQKNRLESHLDADVIAWMEELRRQ